MSATGKRKGKCQNSGKTYHLSATSDEWVLTSTCSVSKRNPSKKKKKKMSPENSSKI